MLTSSWLLLWLIVVSFEIMYHKYNCLYMIIKKSQMSNIEKKLLRIVLLNTLILKTLCCICIFIYVQTLFLNVECVQEFNSEVGEILSKNYPSLVNVRKDCLYIIKPKHSGNSIGKYVLTVDDLYSTGGRKIEVHFINCLFLAIYSTIHDKV